MYYTRAELHRELCSRGVKLHRIEIDKLYEELGVKPISPKDLVKEQILKHGEGFPLEEMAQITKLSYASLRMYYKELGISYSRQGSKVKKEKLKAARERGKELKEAEKQEKIEEAKLHYKTSRTSGFKDKYTQTGTPILDSLRGITTTERIKTVNRSSYKL